MSLTEDIFARRGTWQLFKSVGEHDLSSANIGHIDQRGHLWLRLPDRLLCTDGRNVIWCFDDAVLAERAPQMEGFSGDDCFWVVDGQRRLFSLSLDDGRITDHSDKFPPLDDIRWIRTSEGNSVLLVLSDKILLFDGKEVSQISLPEAELGNLRSGTISPAGNIWLTTDNGLFTVDSGQVVKCDIPNFPDAGLWDVKTGKDDTVWLPLQGAILCLRNGKWEQMPGDDCDSLQSHISLCVDNEGNFWISAHFRGAMCVNSSGSVLFPFEDTPAESWPKCAVQDQTGAFWFTGIGNGVLRYDPGTLNIVQRGYLEASTFEADGKLRIAAASKGLLEYDSETREVSQLWDTVPSRCYGLTLSSAESNLYIASQWGLSVFNVCGNTFQNAGELPDLKPLEGSTVHSSSLDYEGMLWLSTPHFLYRREPSGLKSFSKSELGLAGRVHLFLDASGILWFFSQPNAPILNYGPEGFSTFPVTLGSEFGPPNERVSCCFEDADGNLWVGSGKGNLMRCDVANKRISLEMRLHGGIRDIRIDSDGVKWISTANALVIQDDNHTYRLTEDALLPSRRIVATYGLENGKVLILTERGLCEYRPNRTIQPEVALSKVVADEVHNYPDAPLVSRMRPLLSFYWTSINMKSGPLSFRVKLSGHDSDWVNTARQEVHYEGLPSGDYRFEVIAVDQDLQTNAEIAAIDIQITDDHQQSQIAELENDLKDAEDFAANIFRSVSDSIVVLNTDGNISIANDATSTLLGYEIDELIGNPVSVIFPDEYQNMFDAQGLEMLRKRGHFRARELGLRKRSGDRLPVLVSAACMLDRRDAFKGFVLVASDISEYKTLQEQVLHSQKMESLGMLAGGVAHDFNNLLTVMLGNMDMVRASLEEDSYNYDCLSDALVAARQASKLCSELLAYSGKQVKIQKPLDLSEIVRENAELLRSSVSRGVDIECSLEDDLPKVMGDEVQIMQIVLNLVINAAQAIGDQTGTVSLTTKSKDNWHETELDKTDAKPDDPGSFVLFEVTDTGCGMDEETRSKIFEPFFTTKETGHGLGLSAICGIINSHGGTIGVSSTVGKGTTFQIFLPIIGSSASEL